MTQEEIRERSKTIQAQIELVIRKDSDVRRRRDAAIKRVESRYQSRLDELFRNRNTLKAAKEELQRQCKNWFHNSRCYYGKCEDCGVFNPAPDPDEGNQAHM